MTVRKITLSLPDDLITAAETAVATGRARSISAYVAAAADAGHARLNLAEVINRWQDHDTPTTPEDTRRAEEWVTALTARSDARYAARRSTRPGRAA